ncbi:hypothetical protein Rsub_08546 [Raphidocelis subcapitata]|uniref:Uncharacterized protein n=1 Tax=Raphidocelis subcapitata TaxID=307507 RepID=A0A2V0PEQ0_9CHLO|nr:hypothetical protein Rsub_08546 [Raphidocelis subcapitata]|eukprot:GBF95565.1 hypothetical protein Rsub_08546 [Raphidocelis subcapitata]
MAHIKVATAHVTVDALADQFWQRYLHGTSYAGPEAAAEALLGVLNKLYLQAGRDAVRTFLRSIKEQLAPRQPAARAPAPPAAVFALASSLAVAAERLRQFSPVKGHDKLGAVVLEELRLRLFRIVMGDTFAADTGLRRRALDCCFVRMMQEEETRQRCQERLAAAQNSCAASDSGSSTASAASTPTTLSRSQEALGVQRARSLGRNLTIAGLTGPDTSSWGALWGSIMAGSLGHQAMPLLQSVMADLYTCGGLAAASARSSASTVRSSSFCRLGSKSSVASSPASAAAPPPASPGRLELPDAARAAAPPVDSPPRLPTGRRRASRASDGGDGVSSSPLRSRIGGAAAVWKGRLSAAASGARERMSRLGDGALRGSSPGAGDAPGGDASSGDEAPVAPSALDSELSLGDASPGPAVPAPAEGRDQAAQPQAPQLQPQAPQPEPPPGAQADDRGAKQLPGAPEAPASEAGSEEATDQLPEGWVAFGSEAEAAARGAADPPAQQPAAGHHRRNSSRTLKFWSEESIAWGKDDGAAAAAAGAAAAAPPVAEPLAQAAAAAR